MTALVEGSILAAVGILAAYWTLPVGWSQHLQRVSAGILSNDFARRWDGGCSGWSHGLSVWYLVGDALHWWAYITIPLVLWNLHPIRSDIPFARTTINLVIAFIVGCGITHLIDAYCNINPVYYLLIVVKFCNGVVSVAASVFVAYSLSRAFGEVRYRLEREQQRIDKFKQE